MNVINVLCAQLTRDLFAIAKFLLGFDSQNLEHCSDPRKAHPCAEGGVLSHRWSRPDVP